MNKHFSYVDHCGFAVVAALMLGLAPVRGAMLDSSAWTIRNSSNVVLAAAKDNNIATGVLLNGAQAKLRCVVDLGVRTTVQRLFLASADCALNPSTTKPELSGSRAAVISIWVNDTGTAPGGALASVSAVSVTGREIRVSANLRFQPTVGRYVVIELDRGSYTQDWNLGEVEVFGWAGDQLAVRRDAVTVNAAAPAPLQLAARELSYYLGELAGRPVPVITPADVAAYTGSLFHVVDLKPYAQTWEQMTNAMAQGLIPATPVNVERNGREITFRAFPYRNALWSVWEFLERQGVRWVYPDAHGDYVPTGAGINLDAAPLQVTPSTDFIYANFGVEYLRDDPDAFLHFWRNRWTHTWGGHQRDTFDGSEVPAQPRPAVTIDPAYTEGFAGYPHNFKNVLPERILAQNPSWCGMLTNAEHAWWLGADNLGKRMLPSENWSTFDLTNPDARNFIVQKAIATWEHHAAYVSDILWMLPEDGYLFSEDPASVSRRGALEGDTLPYAFPYPHIVSGDYYDFIAAVATGIQAAVPEAKVGAMAYSNTHRPPAIAEPLPDNVLVEVCLYGARNLPLSSPKNAEMLARLERWAELAKHLRHYDYDLIHGEAKALPMPVPLVTAMADRARFFEQHSMLQGGTQADLASLPYNPWNYYAYPRFHWNTAAEATNVLRDFFTGYFREAATPMHDYYNTLERYLIANDVSLQGRGYDYGVNVGAYPVRVLKRLNQLLQQAESASTYWVTKQRVQSIRAGLDWVLAQRDLSYTDITTTTGFQQVTPDRGITLDLRNVLIQTAGQDVGDAWYLFSWAQVGDYVNFTKPGRYTVTIRAGIGWDDPDLGNRQMMFHIGAQEYGPFRIDHASIDTYTLVVEAPAGVQEVAVVDLYNKGAFEVSTITIQPGEMPAAPQPKMVQDSENKFFDYAVDGNPADRIDSDWDGSSDLHEILSGTDELDPESFFAAVCFEQLASGLCLTWPSVEGKNYSLYRGAALDGTFTLVASDIIATPPKNLYADASAGSGAGFYKIAVY